MIREGEPGKFPGKLKYLLLAAMAMFLASCGGGGSSDEESATNDPTPTTWYEDADSDGYGNADVSLLRVSQPTGYVANADDCNDRSASTYPGATELADGLDNDCDGEVDEGFISFYRDADGDGYGDSLNVMLALQQPQGYVADNSDCNDSDVAVNPSATEVIDGYDNNCDGAIDDVPPAAPVATLSYLQVKKLRFTWPDVAGETEYQLLENEDGLQGYKTVAILPADAGLFDHQVFLPQRVDARYMVRACNMYGCSDSAEISVDVGELIDAIGYFKSSNTGGNDYFGWSVALSDDGSTLAVGARYESSSSAGINGNQGNDDLPNAGAVYLFVRDANGEWSQQAYMKASNPDPSDEFGYALDLSDDGNTLAVGAPGEDSSATGVNGNFQSSNDAYASGAAYVFVRNGGIWTQQAYLKASNTHQNYSFGRSVALSGNGETLAVGSPGESGGSRGINGDQSFANQWESGAVYVFVRNGADWSQQAYVKASNADAYDEFGWSVALSDDGNTLAAGAYYESSAASGVNGDQSDNLAQASGASYVFVRGDSGWEQQAYLKASNTEQQDWFGYSLALSGDGNTLAVGAIHEDSGVTSVNGPDDDNSRSESGAAYVFRRDAGTWSQQAYIKATNTDVQDYFGMSLSLNDDGGLLAIGAPREAGASPGLNGDQSDDSWIEQGAAYLFERRSGQWFSHSYIKAPNIEYSRMFGQAVDLSGDGSSLAAGAYLESSASTGVSGNQNGAILANSGAVYLY